jgi:hypothetical protein
MTLKIFFHSHDFQEVFRAINPPFYSGTSNIQGDQKVSVHLMITVQSSGAQRLFDHPVQMQVILLALTCLLICQRATKKQSWIEVMTPFFFISADKS